MQKSILIVEDNELNMKLFNDLLEAHGYKTVQTRSGVEAVELARLHKPDLILMDIQLPRCRDLRSPNGSRMTRAAPYSGHCITAFAMKETRKRSARRLRGLSFKTDFHREVPETVRNYLHEQ